MDELVLPSGNEVSCAAGRRISCLYFLIPWLLLRPPNAGRRLHSYPEQLVIAACPALQQLQSSQPVPPSSQPSTTAHQSRNEASPSPSPLTH